MYCWGACWYRRSDGESRSIKLCIPYGRVNFVSQMWCMARSFDASVIRVAYTLGGQNRPPSNSGAREPVQTLVGYHSRSKPGHAPPVTPFCIRAASESRSTATASLCDLYIWFTTRNEGTGDPTLSMPSWPVHSSSDCAGDVRMLS